MFKAFWEKVRLSLSVWLNANKTGFAWFGKQCARFGRWYASLWKKHLQAPVLKALQLHWIPTLLLVIISAVLLIYAFAWPDANPVVAYAGYFISAYTLAVVCFSMPKIFNRQKTSDRVFSVFWLWIQHGLCHI